VTARNDRIALSTWHIAEEVAAGRVKAHQKHGANSIEVVAADDPRWLSILVEEVGEYAHELTYDSLADLNLAVLTEDERHMARLRRQRAEALDVATVAVALIDSIDRELKRLTPDEPRYHPLRGERDLP
jgi:hypothetical protein